MAKRIPYTLEYTVRSSPGILYEFLSTTSGLQEWFADMVKQRDGVYSFNWNGSVEKAKVVDKNQDEFIRFHWMDTPENEYFEFRIRKSEVTSETVLLITDFAEKNEVHDESQLWDTQLKDLFHRIGS
ncbi:MAG: ATPase [Chitinophagaceae bacterium]|nr:MAG: ATPase [Chitinophagaceae bacterium]